MVAPPRNCESPQRALTGPARALLGIRLLGRAADHGDRLGLVIASAALGQLIIHHPGQDVLADFRAEDRLIEIDLTNGFIVQIF